MSWEIYQPICDFCCSREDKVVWAYPCTTFEMKVTEDIGGTSHGGWAACDKCHELIKANNREGLVQRSFENLVHTEGLISPFYKMAIKELHQTFFANRKGEPTPV